MPNPAVFTYEMGYTQGEFGRVLNAGFTNDRSPYACQPESPRGWHVTHKEQSIQVSIQLTALPERVLGAIALPVLQVRFEVTNASAKQTDEFFDKFFKYFHKGGG